MSLRKNIENTFRAIALFMIVISATVLVVVTAVLTGHLIAAILRFLGVPVT